MRKKVIAMLTAGILLLGGLPGNVFATGDPGVGAPQNVTLTDEIYNSEEEIVGINMKFNYDSKFLAAVTPSSPDADDNEYEARVYYEFKINDGSWFAYPESRYESFWSTDYAGGSNTYDERILYFQPGFEDSSRAEETFNNFKPILKTVNAGGNENSYILDKANNKMEVRVRFELVASDDTEENTIYTSPWASAKWGKEATASKPSAFPNAPVLSDIRVQLSGTDQRPQVTFKVVHPADVLAASTNPLGTACFYLQVNYDNTGWQNAHFENVGWLHTDGTTWIDLPDRSDGKEIKIDATALQLRMCYEWYDGAIQNRPSNHGEAKPTFSSPWSNTIGINVDAWSKASPWATAELEKAKTSGLIPDCLKGADMTKPINRAEFAALSVKLYEAMSGKTAMSATDNPFVDTTDPEVMKAYKLGITSGTSATTFEPKLLIPREQVATMLTRTVKAVKPDIKIDITGIPTFADDARISSWAKESVYFMAKNGIVNGVGGNKFAPKNTTAAEIAAGYANATREQAIAIAMRSLDALK